MEIKLMRAKNARAMKTGQLIVFEGPDGVGKSDLALRFRTWLREHGFAAELLSFPGKEEGTLGKLVYDLHLHPERFHLTTQTPASLQAMHIAAHLDAIERRILPSLKSGRIVVLDRFWWSTFVYGIASGVDQRLVEQMISTEKVAWGSVKPTILFMVDRSAPLRQEPSTLWVKWRDGYRGLLSIEKTQYTCELIANEHGIEETLQQVLKSWRQISGN